MGVELGYKTTSELTEDVVSAILEEVSPLNASRDWTVSESITFLSDEKMGVLEGSSKIDVGVAAVEVNSDVEFVLNTLSEWSERYSFDWAITLDEEQTGKICSGQLDQVLLDLIETMSGVEVDEDLFDGDFTEKSGCRTIEKKIFERVKIESKEFLREKISFDRCEFRDAALFFVDGSIDLNDRPRIRNIHISRSKIDDLYCGYVHFENVFFDNLKTRRVEWIRGATFKNCKFTGSNGALVLAAMPAPKNPFSTLHLDILASNNQYYKDVEVALDISEANFKELDLRGIPGEKVKVNGDTQVVIDYCKIHLIKDALLDVFSESSARSLEYVLKCHEETEYNIVLVANPKSKYFEEEMELISEAKSHGLIYNQ